MKPFITADGLHFNPAPRKTLRTVRAIHNTHMRPFLIGLEIVFPGSDNRDYVFLKENNKPVMCTPLAAPLAVGSPRMQRCDCKCPPNHEHGAD